MAKAQDDGLKKLKAEAQSLYENGMKLTDIAKKIGKPDGTVRRWKSEGGWGYSSNKNKRNNQQFACFQILSFPHKHFDL